VTALAVIVVVVTVQIVQETVEIAEVVVTAAGAIFLAKRITPFFFSSYQNHPKNTFAISYVSLSTVLDSLTPSIIGTGRTLVPWRAVIIPKLPW